MPAIESPTAFQAVPQAIAKVRGSVYYVAAALVVGIGVAVLYAFQPQGQQYAQQLPAPITTPDTAWFEREVHPPPPPPEPVSFPQALVQPAPPPPAPQPVIQQPAPPNPDVLRRREVYLRALSSPLVADG